MQGFRYYSPLSGARRLSDELDLGFLANALAARFKLILAAGAAGALAAFGLSLLLWPVFSASALVLVIEPTSIELSRSAPAAAQRSVPAEAPLASYPEIASSDAILHALLQELEAHDAFGRGIDDLEDLRENVAAASGRDRRLVRMTAESRLAEGAAWMANRWAELFVERVNRAIDGGEERLEYLVQQRDRARGEMRDLERQAVAFQSESRRQILESELAALRDAQARHTRQLTDIDDQLDRLRRLRLRLESGDSTAPVTMADTWSAALLQLRLLGVGGEGVELRLGEPTTERSAAEVLRSLSDLSGAFAGAGKEISGRIRTNEPRLLELQSVVEDLTVREADLRRRLALAAEAYEALARAVEEERIRSSDTAGGLRILAEAVLPDRPVRPRKLLNTVLGALLGTIVAVAVIVYRTLRSPARVV